MKFNEPLATNRGLPVYLHDEDNEPVTGVIPTGSEIQVTLSGDAWVDAEGVWSEVGGGLYRYEATQDESKTACFLGLKIDVPGADRFLIFEDIGNRIQLGEPTPSLRLLPIYLVDENNDPVTSLDLTGEVSLSVNGGAFLTGVGSISETGDGAYVYQATLVEVSVGPYSVLRVIDEDATPFFLAFDLLEPEEDAVEVPGPEPIPAAVTPESVEYRDFVALALDRLPFQFRDPDV